MHEYDDYMPYWDENKTYRHRWMSDTGIDPINRVIARNKAEEEYAERERKVYKDMLYETVGKVNDIEDALKTDPQTVIESYAIVDLHNKFNTMFEEMKTKYERALTRQQDQFDIVIKQMGEKFDDHIETYKKNVQYYQKYVSMPELIKLEINFKFESGPEDHEYLSLNKGHWSVIDREEFSNLINYTIDGVNIYECDNTADSLLIYKKISHEIFFNYFQP